VDSYREKVESFAGAVYGTIVVAGVLAAASGYQRPSAGAAAAYAAVTVLVLWLAESWAHSVGQRMAGVATTRTLRSSLRRRWALAQDAVAPLAGVGLARALGTTHE
jgi:hypothetical protein